MTSRPRTRWLLERLAFLLLCICVATGYELGRALWHSRPAPRKSEATGTCLDRRVTLKVVDMPLEQVVGELSRQTGQPIEADWGRISRDWGDVRRATVTADLDNVTLESALQAVFSDAAPRVPIGAVVSDDFIRARVAPQAPFRYGVSRGVVRVSSRPQAWDVVVGTYEVGDLLQGIPDQPGPSPSTPVSFVNKPALALGVGSFGGPFVPAPPIAQPYTTGRLGPVPTTPTLRATALEHLTSLVYSFLRDDGVEATRGPTATQWGERLIVVATEPQQRDLERFLDALRAGIAAQSDPAASPEGGN